MRDEIVFERYGRAMLARKFPSLRPHLKNIEEGERDLPHLCSAYGAAIALRDEMRKQVGCDPVVLQAVEMNCDELETEISWSVQLPTH